MRQRQSPPCRSLLFGAVVLLALGLPGRAQAGEAYFVVMFGAQRIPNNPNYAHTFSTFVRITWAGNGPCCRPFAVEAHTISWTPRTLVIRIQALLPECGDNFDLYTTLRYVLGSRER